MTLISPTGQHAPSTTEGMAEVLRTEMVDQVRRAGHARSSTVEAAMRTVPRHHYVPEASLEWYQRGIRPE